MIIDTARRHVEEAKAEREAREAELATIDARVADLDARIAALGAEIDGMRQAAVNAFADGSPAAINGMALKRAEREVAEAALQQLRQRRDTAAMELQRARSAEDVAGRLCARVDAAVTLRDLAPVVADMVERVSQSSEARTVVLAAMAETLPSAASARLLVESARLFRIVGETLTPPLAIQPEPASDTLVKSSRKFVYRYRAGDERTAPANWVGFVPTQVADLLVAAGAAKKIDLLVKVILRGKGLQLVPGIRTQLNGKSVSMALVPSADADSLVANDCAIRLSEAPTPADYALAFGGSYDFNGHALDLGTIDAPATEIEGPQISPSTAPVTAATPQQADQTDRRPRRIAPRAAAG